MLEVGERWSLKLISLCFLWSPSNSLSVTLSCAHSTTWWIKIYTLSQCWCWLYNIQEVMSASRKKKSMCGIWYQKKHCSPHPFLPHPLQLPLHSWTSPSSLLLMFSSPLTMLRGRSMKALPWKLFILTTHKPLCHCLELRAILRWPPSSATCILCHS